MFHRNLRKRRKREEEESEERSNNAELQRIFEEKECKNYCFVGAKCIVHIDPNTNTYIGKECRCPKNYSGAQCNEYFLKDLFKSDPAANRGEPTQNIAVPGLTFILILLIFACFLARHSYKRFLKKQKADFKQWRTTIHDSALQASPYSPKSSPRYASTVGWSPFMIKSGHISFPETTIGNQNNSKASCFVSHNISFSRHKTVQNMSRRFQMDNFL